MSRRKKDKEALAKIILRGDFNECRKALDKATKNQMETALMYLAGVHSK